MRIQFRHFPQTSERPLFVRKLAAWPSRLFSSVTVLWLTKERPPCRKREESLGLNSASCLNTSVKSLVSCLPCFMLQNQSSPQTLFLYNIHFITFYRNKLVSIKWACIWRSALSSELWKWTEKPRKVSSERVSLVPFRLIQDVSALTIIQAVAGRCLGCAGFSPLLQRSDGEQTTSVLGRGCSGALQTGKR